MIVMTGQPLHECCDDIYTVQILLDGCLSMLKENKVIHVYEEIERLKTKLDRPLSKFRNVALKQEGDYDP